MLSSLDLAAHDASISRTALARILSGLERNQHGATLLLWGQSVRQSDAQTIRQLLDHSVLQLDSDQVTEAFGIWHLERKGMFAPRGDNATYFWPMIPGKRRPSPQ